MSQTPVAVVAVILIAVRPVNEALVTALTVAGVQTTAEAVEVALALSASRKEAGLLLVSIDIVPPPPGRAVTSTVLATKIQGLTPAVWVIRIRWFNEPV